MPAQRLTDEPVRLERFDVLGEDSESVPGFVCHVGLAIETKEALSLGEQVSVWHMGPPLENPGSMAANSLGSAVLTVDEANQIQLYLDEIEFEYDAAPRRPNWLQQYVVHPHVKPWCAKDGTPLWLRFSCAGLVIESYGDAGIDLVSQEDIEDMDAEVLDKAYPRFAPVTGLSPRRREYLGIPGKGPWPVLLAGYVLHALDRTAEDIRLAPYQPTLNDATFP